MYPSQGPGQRRPGQRARQGLEEADTLYQKCQGAAAMSVPRPEPIPDTDRDADTQEKSSHRAIPKRSAKKCGRPVPH